MDPADPRVFGYIYNTSDERHQFWAIKTERPAQSAVLTMKDLFEEAFQHMNRSDDTQTETNSTPTFTENPAVSVLVKIFD